MRIAGFPRRRVDAAFDPMDLVWTRSRFATIRARSGLGNTKVVIGVAILAVFLLAALLAPLIAPGDPNDYVDLPNLRPSFAHWLGTTGQGQDVFAQIVWGTRRSLGLGIVIGVVTTVVGILVGLVAAFAGGVVDQLLNLVINIFIIMPGLPLLVALAAILPAGPLTIVAVLAITGWAGTARVLRAQALSIRAKDYTAASLLGGEQPLRVILVEMLPNMASIAMSSLIGSILYGVGAQAGLEFLGLGDIDAVSWGTMLYWAGTNASLLLGAWWAFVPAGAAIAIVALALVMINFAIDEVANPRLRTEARVAHVFRRFDYQPGRATPVVRRRRDAADA